MLVHDQPNRRYSIMALLAAPLILTFAAASGAAPETPPPPTVRPERGHPCPPMERGHPCPRIALCQTLCIDGDREGNFDRIEQALKEANEGRAQIACFPETAILGWVNPEAHQRAFPIPGPDTDRLAALAKQHQTMICIGLAEKDGDRLYDSAVLIDSAGRLLLKHRKINTLTELMDPPYTRGDTIEAVDTEYGRIGLLICADTFVNKIVNTMKSRRPDLVLVPFGWAAQPHEWPGHGDSLRDRVRKTAKAIGAPVVGTDLIGEITHGPWKGRTYGGQSVACDAGGNVLVRGKDRQSQILFVNLPLAPRPASLPEKK